MKIKDFDGEVKVLATKGNKSLIWIVKATLEPYVIVDNYDPKTNSWKYGSYYRSYEQAKKDFNKIKDSKLYKIGDKIVKASSVNDAINKVKDYPLAFKPNLSLSALKSNISNSDEMQIKRSLISIEADIDDWKKYDKEGTFKSNNNLKLICKKLANDYINVLNSIDKTKFSKQFNDKLDKVMNKLENALKTSLYG